MKKSISLLLAAVIVFAALSALSVSVSAAGGSVDMGDVVQLGDFESLTEGFIVFYPKELETSNKTYPVAVWANGTMCMPVDYISYLTGVAKAGYVVVASSELMSGDGERQIEAVDYILDECLKEGSVFCGKINPNKIAAFGHSQGGKSSVNAALNDDRIGCVVSVAGCSTSSQTKKLSTPTLFIAGGIDTIVAPSIWIKPSYESAQGPAVYACLKKAGHTACIVDAEPYIKYTVKWFDLWLNGGDDSIFRKDGELFCDDAWKSVKSKNMPNLSNSTIASVFSEANPMGIMAIVELLIIVVGASVVITKSGIKKKSKKDEE